MSDKSYRSRIKIPVILAIIMPMLIGLFFLLKSKYELPALFLFSISANSFIPFPHEPIVIYYGKMYSPFIVSIICGTANCISSVIDYVVFEIIFSHKKITELKGKNKLYKYAEHYFSQTPFWTMVFAGFSPIPFYPFRVIAVASGYYKWKYVISTFIGRVPRYYILAWIGNKYFIDIRYIIILFFVMIIPPLIKIIRSRFHINEL